MRVWKNETSTPLDDIRPSGVLEMCVMNEILDNSNGTIFITVYDHIVSTNRRP